MNKMKTHFSLIAVLGFALTFVTDANADEGWYLGGAFGKAFLNETIDGISLDADSSSWRLYGGYGFTEYFGVEVAYLDLGTFRETVDAGGVDVPLTASADGYSVAVTGTLPFTERFSGTARLGMYFHDSETSVAGISEPKLSEESPFIGIGVAYDINDVLELNLGFDYIDTDNVEPMLATLGLTLRF